MGFLDILVTIFTKGKEYGEKSMDNYQRKLGQASRDTLRKCDEIENSGKELSDQQRETLEEIRGKANRYQDY